MSFDPAKEITRDSIIMHHPAITKEDSMRIAHEIDSTDYLLVFENKTNTWLDTTLGRQHSTWADFHLIEYSSDNGHQVHPTAPDNQFLTDYAPLLIWSPDSTYFLDIGSDSHELVKGANGKMHLEFVDLENTIDLINYKLRTSEKIFFFGFSTSAWDAHWMDTSHVALLGRYNPNSDGHPDTILWVINIKNNFISKYKFTRSQ
jgi:hypothetical protein